MSEGAIRPSARGADVRFDLHDGAWLDIHDAPGPGMPIVLLAGILDDAHVWDAVVGPLRAAGHRVIRIDDRAHGDASPFEAGIEWGPERVADDVIEYISAAHPSGVHLVGHSRGGTAASWAALQEPELVKTLTVVASPPQASEVFRALFRGLLDKARHERERDAYRYLSRIPDDAFPAEALRRLEAPQLVVEAEDDPLYSPTGTLFWRMFLPYATFLRVPGGHRFFVERDGGEMLADAILAHVDNAEKA